MKKFLPTIGLFMLLLAGTGHAYAIRIAEKPVSDTVTATSGEVFRPDTLVDLNAHLHGVKEVIVPKGTVIPEAIEITPQGQIILKSDALLKADKYKFELKVTASDKEVYIVQVQIARNGDKLVVNTVSDRIEMATGFRKEGKIYVVVAVSLILFSTIVVYLVLLDRRMRRINASIQKRTSH